MPDCKDPFRAPLERQSNRQAAQLHRAGGGAMITEGPSHSQACRFRAETATSGSRKRGDCRSASSHFKEEARTCPTS